MTNTADKTTLRPLNADEANRWLKLELSEMWLTHFGFELKYHNNDQSSDRDMQVWINPTTKQRAEVEFTYAPLQGERYSPTNREHLAIITYSNPV